MFGEYPNCMHSGEFLLAASVLLVLLIIAGGITALIVWNRQPGKGQT